MKTTYTIAAIAMFAVILGMGTLSPALADRNSEHNPKKPVCHFYTDINDDGDLTLDDNAWAEKLVNKHAKKAHTGHGDKIIVLEENLTDPETQITALECPLQDPPVDNI